MISSKDVPKLLKIARAQGVKRLKMDGFEVEFGEVPQKQLVALTHPMHSEETETPPTDEELLMWSSGVEEKKTDGDVH